MFLKKLHGILFLFCRLQDIFQISLFHQRSNEILLLWCMQITGPVFSMELKVSASERHSAFRHLGKNVLSTRYDFFYFFGTFHEAIIVSACPRRNPFLPEGIKSGTNGINWAPRFADLLRAFSFPLPVNIV